MEHALIIETDRHFARHLRQELSNLRPLRIVVAPTLADAQHTLWQQPQDWAFVSLLHLCETVQFLRDMQPDIRIIVLLPLPDAELPVACADEVQGVVIKTDVNDSLLPVLNSALSQRPFTSEIELNGDNTAQLIAALQLIELNNAIHTAIIGQQMHYVAHWGTLSLQYAQQIAQSIGETWQSEHARVQIQFDTIETQQSEILLYTHQIHKNYFVTLVARSDVALFELRQLSERSAQLLLDALQGKSLLKKAPPPNSENAYALAWRPQEPLNNEMITAVSHALPQLAQANGCQLSHTDIQAEYCHIVVACPPNRDGSWAATLFKNGSESILQPLFELQNALWAKGFYATDSIRPLTQTELNLFLTD